MLNQLIEKHPVRSAALCSGTGRSRAYISKVRSGGFVPSDYGTVLDLARAIGLDEAETMRLTECYQAAKAPESLQGAWTAFDACFTLRPSVPVPAEGAAALRHGQLIGGREAVLQAVQGLTRNARQLCMFVTPLQDALRDICVCVCAGAGSGAPVRWVTLLDDTEHAADRNTDVFLNVLRTLLVRNTGSRALKGNVDFLLRHTVHPFYILSERALLLLNADGDSAVYLEAPELLRVYAAQFDACEASAAEYVHSYEDVERFLRDIPAFTARCGAADPELYVIKKYPCLVLESLTSDIHQYIADMEHADTIADLYISFLSEVGANIRRMHSIFPEEGLDTYLNSEEFYEITKHFTKPIPTALRRGLLGKLVGLCDDGEVVPYLLRMPGLRDSSLYVENIWSDGRMILMYDFGEHYRIFTVYDPDMAQAVIRYIGSMVKCGILRTKEASVRIIREALQEYQTEVSE
ncbi:MAG: hypothetical protein IJ055_05055 [Oscillospiraceae bacterium]|nr:hypothetical protein [Oscillospiraceae bacterium]